MADFSLLSNYRQDPSVMNALQTHTWRQELCGCFDNCGVCILTYFLPCITFGQTAEALGKSCCVYGCLYTIPIADIIVHLSQREEIRNIRGIPGSCCEDFMMKLFCSPCMLCQEHVEMDAVKIDLVGVLAARNQGGTVVIQTHMQPSGQQQTHVTVAQGNMVRI